MNLMCFTHRSITPKHCWSVFREAAWVSPRKDEIIELFVPLCFAKISQEVLPDCEACEHAYGPQTLFTESILQSWFDFLMQIENKFLIIALDSKWKRRKHIFKNKFD